MCAVLLNAAIEGTVNSPNLAIDQNVVVKHAKSAASNGEERSSAERINRSMGTVKGSCFGQVDEGGANLVAPVNAVVSEF